MIISIIDTDYFSRGILIQTAILCEIYRLNKNIGWHPKKCHSNIILRLLTFDINFWSALLFIVWYILWLNHVLLMIYKHEIMLFILQNILCYRTGYN